jgi:uncharacterized protein YecE (DUF72 family)
VTKAYIGTSGWNYKHWANGVFYPQTVKPPDWLRHYARTFDTVEINNSFYHLPTAATFRKWRTTAPRGFTFSVKASRFLTHIKRLRDPEDPLDLFLSRARELKETLGPVLFQLPPQFKANIDRLRTFLGVWRRRAARSRLRAALEVRHESWLTSDVFLLLKKHDVALCFADWRDLRITSPVTASFVYVRRHSGPDAGNYPQKSITDDASRVREWLQGGLDVYVYYNNDPQGHAVRNAVTLQHSIAASFRD